MIENQNRYLLAFIFLIDFETQNIFVMILTKNTCQKVNYFMFLHWITSSVKNS
jgi:hypothetical protein